MVFYCFFGNSQTIQKSIQKSKTLGLPFTPIQQLHHYFNTANGQISSTAVERRPDDFKETPVDPSKIILTKHQIHHFLFPPFLIFAKINVFFIILLIFSSIMNQIVISLTISFWIRDFFFLNWCFLRTAAITHVHPSAHSHVLPPLPPPIHACILPSLPA